MAVPDAPWRLREGVGLGALSTLGVGGVARFFITAASIDEIVEAHDWARRSGHELLVLGGGSNIVVADRGFAGLVLQVARRGLEWTEDGEWTRVQAGAGESWDDLVAATVDRNLAGIECLSGIPGTVGGVPVQNVGAYGQEVADSIEAVTVFDRVRASTVTLTSAECRFSYRSSRFKRTDRERYIVCDVTLRLRGGLPTTTYPDVQAELARRGIESASLGDLRSTVLAVRRRKGMVIDEHDPDSRSVGSFFVNPVLSAERYTSLVSVSDESEVPAFRQADGAVKVPAAWLIEHAGFGRGYTAGRTGLSSKHPLALVNRGGASAREVVQLAATIKRAVAARYGIALHPEPVFVGFEGDPEVEYLQQEQA